MNAGGPNQSWDFSNLKENIKVSEAYIAASAAPGYNSFPTANLAMVNQMTSQFFKSTTKNLEFLGTFNNGNPLFGGANVFDKPAVILRTPIDYLDQYDYTTNTQIAISGAFIPDSLTMGISVDSIRIKIKQDAIITADAWGKVKLKITKQIMQ